MVESRHKLETVLFDLDGTLADTAPDMTAALNRLLLEQGREPLDSALVRNHVSRGAAALVQLAFGNGLPNADFEWLRERFLQLYATDLCSESRLFPGMAHVLAHIENIGLRFGLTSRAACIVSGDTTDQRKPHPKPLLHACLCCGNTAQQCVYIGDDPRDIQAGEAAGMTTLVALYGYIDDEQDPHAWGADGVLKDVAELPAWLETVVHTGRKAVA
jgi:phosphoglycolate phosphatase-like HAD superfamily hydrolase